MKKNVLLIGALLLLISVGKSKSPQTKVITINKERIVKAPALEFTPENLYNYIKKCGIKFPYIVYSQALLESGHFKSNIFKKANNLFGMKVAKSRPTTAIKEYSGHAYYEDWMMSVQDYALFQSAYLRKIKTEDSYYEYLSENYAGDPTYVEKVRAIADKFKSE